ncbi:MAG: glutamyl-tRNA reductase [Armatimonadota bacterium]
MAEPSLGKPMPAQVIQVVGVSHRQASVSEREQLGFGRSVYALLARAREALRASECVLLRTCNRVELYCLAPFDEPTRAAAAALLADNAGSSLSEDQLYHFVGPEAVRHLFSVASGLDSMVLGEHEILGQVRRAVADPPRQPGDTPLSEATSAETTEPSADSCAGPVLRRLFDHAVRTGKRARRETAISSGIFSVGQCAARMAQGVIGSLQGRRVLIFGAGRIARTTAKHLSSFGVASIAVFSRTHSRACELADCYAGHAVTADELPAALADSDILVGCASAPHYVIGPAELAPVVSARPDRPLVVIDLGVPRNVDPAAAETPGVHLFNIDDLERVVSEHADEREREVQRVRAIVAEEATEFSQWLDERSVSGLITALVAKAESARQECLGLAERRLSGQELATVGYLLDLLARKLLHDPIAAIREAAAGNGSEADVMAAARQLFGLAADTVQETAAAGEPAPGPEGREEVHAQED